MKLSPSEVFATYLINNKLMEIMGLPKKDVGVKKNYQGYFSLIYKWIHKDRHDVKYIWFVVNHIHRWWQGNPKKITTGYFYRVFTELKRDYAPDDVHLPYSASREECLEHGLTVEQLPFHLLTTAERKKLEEDVPVTDVTDEDRESFRKLLERV